MGRGRGTHIASPAFREGSEVAPKEQQPWHSVGTPKHRPPASDRSGFSPSFTGCTPTSMSHNFPGTQYLRLENGITIAPPSFLLSSQEKISDCLNYWCPALCNH